MTYRDLIRKLKNYPDYYLDDTVKIEIPIGNTDDYSEEKEVEYIDFAYGHLTIKTETLWAFDAKNHFVNTH